MKKKSLFCVSVILGSLTLLSQSPAYAGQFRIDLQFDATIPPSQQKIFREAGQFWESAIEGARAINKPYALAIKASAFNIDGAGGILGQAGPTEVLRGTAIPVAGAMSFDTEDLANMESNGTLKYVIRHEIGHIMGIGTTWELTPGLIDKSDASNPVCTGGRAAYEYYILRYYSTPGTQVGDQDVKRPVPLENQGGPGTRGSHWREGIFGNELMTGYVNNLTNPLSKLTLGVLEDTGYIVNWAAAEPYSLPSQAELQALRQLPNLLKEMLRPDYKFVDPVKE